VEQARGAISAAEAETAVFEDKLRAAKREIYEARDAKLKQWAAERDQAIERAKAQTAEKVGVARQALEQSAVTAKQQIEAMSGELSAQVMKAVLPKGISGTEAAQ
jgi:F-type H+-transporting ATPase subunit b